MNYTPSPSQIVRQQQEREWAAMTPKPTTSCCAEPTAIRKPAIESELDMLSKQLEDLHVEAEGLVMRIQTVLEAPQPCPSMEGKSCAPDNQLPPLGEKLRMLRRRAATITDMISAARRAVEL